MKQYILIAGILLIKASFVPHAESFDLQGVTAIVNNLMVGTPGKKAFCKKVNFLSEEGEAPSSFSDSDKDEVSAVLIEDASVPSKDSNLS